MSARIFLAGAAAGAVVGALAMFAIRPDGAAIRIAEDAMQSADEVGASSGSSSAPAGKSTQPAAPSAAGLVADAGSATLPGLVTTRPHAVVPPNTDDAYLRSLFDAWSESPGIGQLNDRLKAEARDEAWASDMETQLQDYLARRPSPNAIGSVSVECRMTLCRVISVVSNTVFEAVPYSDLQAALNDLANESLGHELAISNLAVSVDPAESSQTMEVAMLRRVRETAGSRP